MARRFDRIEALVIFAHRLAPGSLEASPNIPTWLDFGPGLDILLRLAESADITVVIPDPNP